MAKGNNQKLKLLYLRDYLRSASDESHPVSVTQIIAYLASKDIPVERKTVYDDIACLQQYGEDIVLAKGKNGGYFCASREFDLPEIKMLVDSVQSSKFITEAQSLALIKKLEQLTNVYEAGHLQRQVIVHNRVKTEQTSVFSNIDHISNAIYCDRTIKFRYFTYDLQKQPVFRHDGQWYEISPCCLIWDDENYYLLGYDDAAQQMKHFRVDKMKHISMTENVRDPQSAFDAIDIPAYSKKVFRMFRGEEKTVTLRFENHLVGVVLDHFGKSITLIPDRDGTHFTVTVAVAISKQFYSWLFGFAGECEILSPADVRQEMIDYANLTLAQYADNG